MSKIKWFLELLFKALGLHDGTKKLLLVFVILTVLQMPFSVPGLWRMGWGIWLSWKNDTPAPTMAIRPPETFNSYPASGDAGGGNAPHKRVKEKHTHWPTVPLAVAPADPPVGNSK